MKISIKKSSLICPAQTTPTHRMWLSNLDLFHRRAHVPLAYLYNSDTNFQAEKLKEALGKILVPFYPAAGRLERDDKGRIEIDCNGKGVLFVEAETDFAMAGVDDLVYMPSSEFLQLIPATGDENDLSSFPLVAIQVTRFSSGKVCIGIGWHHTLGDGNISLQFINAWSDIVSDIVRGHSDHILPSPYLDRSILRSRVSPTPKFPHIEYDQPIINLNDPSEPITLSLIEITPQHLNTLRANATNGHERITKYSTFELLSAHVWRSAIRARELPHDQVTKLYVTVDGRSRFKHPVPQEYLGNVIFFATPTAPCGEILLEALSETIERVHKAIKRMDDEYLRSAIDFLEKVDDIEKTREGPQRGGNGVSPDVKIVSWKQLPFYKADFGWGKPMHVRGSFPQEGKGHFLPRPSHDGHVSLAISFETRHMQSFKMYFYDAMVNSSFTSSSKQQSKL